MFVKMTKQYGVFEKDSVHDFNDVISKDLIKKGLAVQVESYSYVSKKTIRHTKPDTIIKKAI